MVSYIETKDLVKVYRIGKVEIQALRGLSMSIEQGEMIAIVGPSGSGKTTLLNIIGGLTSATAGQVWVAGREITAATPAQLGYLRQRIVGHIFQTLNLIPTLTAFENVELPMLAVNAPQSERRKRAEILLETVGLQDRMNHKPDELSGGEKQRVAIAAALANDPPILICDEPTGDLDTETGARVVEFLHRVNKEMGKTVIIVTHDPAIARQTDRIYRILDGRIVSVQRPTDTEEKTAALMAQMLRDRITETDLELQELELKYRRQEIEPEKFAARWNELVTTREFLRRELHRMGF